VIVGSQSLGRSRQNMRTIEEEKKGEGGGEAHEKGKTASVLRKHQAAWLGRQEHEGGFLRRWTREESTHLIWSGAAPAMAEEDLRRTNQPHAQ